MESKKILIIEDDKAISRLLTISLTTNKYETIVAENGATGISLFLSDNPDLILLDMGLPDMDGMEVLAQIKRISNIPIIIVSARGKEREKVEALDAGADDYVTKPFNIGELLARLRVAFRKTVVREYPDNVFTLGELSIDFEKRKVMVGEENIHLTPIEFKMLSLLIDYQGKVLTHSFIQDKIWGYASNDDYQTLRVFMASIRRKIEKDTNAPRYILTEVGVGYRLSDE